MYYGKDRTKYLRQLENYGLVITTYSVVRLDWKTWLTEPNNPSTLHAAKWRRIVLDEGSYENNHFTRKIDMGAQPTLSVSRPSPLQNLSVLLKRKGVGL